MSLQEIEKNFYHNVLHSLKMKKKEIVMVGTLLGVGLTTACAHVEKNRVPVEHTLESSELVATEYKIVTGYLPQEIVLITLGGSVVPYRRVTAKVQQPTGFYNQKTIYVPLNGEGYLNEAESFEKQEFIELCRQQPDFNPDYLYSELEIMQMIQRITLSTNEIITYGSRK